MCDSDSDFLMLKLMRQWYLLFIDLLLVLGTFGWFDPVSATFSVVPVFVTKFIELHPEDDEAMYLLGSCLCSISV